MPKRKTKTIVTPDYSRRAVDKYQQQHDMISTRMPLYTRERIQQLLHVKGISSVAKYVAYATLKQLEEDEAKLLPPGERCQLPEDKCINYTDLPHDQWIYPE